MTWCQEAESLLLQGNYQELATFYEEAIAHDPDNVDNYWYLGLAYLLVEKEEEAQTTWFLPFSLASEIELLAAPNTIKLSEDLIIKTLDKVLYIVSSESIDFARACLE